MRKRVGPGDILRAERARAAHADTPAPATPAPERQVAFRLGLSAESRAAAYLIAKGYRIMARRWRSPAGEIDIIARRGNTIAFVEVKARETTDHAAEAISEMQQQRIATAASVWIGASPAFANFDMRFDAVLVAPGRIPVHIPGAFELDPSWD